MMDKLYKPLKGVVTVAEQQTQKLHEWFNSELRGRKQNIGVALQDIEVAQLEVEAAQ
jgi:ABC-type methionine transport system ATPase subunit